MTTITTFEDILAVLEQNPQLREAMRNYILDEELKQLPAIVRRNQELLEQFIQQQAEITAKLQAGIDQLNDTLNRFMASTNAMLVAPRRTDGPPGSGRIGTKDGCELA